MPLTQEQNAIRSSLMQSDVKRETVTYNGVEVEVLHPTLAQRGTIQRAGGIGAAEGTPVDLSRMQVAAVIACTVFKGTTTPIFGDADLEALMAQRTGGSIDTLAQVAGRLLNPSGGNAAKKSEATQSASSSSTSP